MKGALLESHSLGSLLEISGQIISDEMSRAADEKGNTDNTG